MVRAWLRELIGHTPRREIEGAADHCGHAGDGDELRVLGIDGCEGDQRRKATNMGVESLHAVAVSMFVIVVLVRLEG